MTWLTSVDIETAGGDVGGDQDIGLTGAEAAHDAVALGLGEIAVERLGRVAARHQRLAELVDLMLGAAEDHRRAMALRHRGCGSGRRSCGCAGPRSRPASISGDGHLLARTTEIRCGLFM